MEVTTTWYLVLSAVVFTIGGVTGSVPCRVG